VRNRFPGLISLNPNKLPRQLYLPTAYYRARRVHVCPLYPVTYIALIGDDRYRPLSTRSLSVANANYPNRKAIRLDQCCRVTQCHVHLRIIYLNLSKSVTARSYERSTRARARARERGYPHTRGTYTHAAPREKGRHLGAKLTLLRLHRLTSIPVASRARFPKLQTIPLDPARVEASQSQPPFHKPTPLSLHTTP